jgi:hypothetical protein
LRSELKSLSAVGAKQKGVLFVQRVQPSDRLAVHEQERFPAKAKAAVHRESGPMLRDRPHESDLDWSSQRRPGFAGPQDGPVGTEAGAKLSLINELTVPITPGVEFEQTDFEPPDGLFK